MKKSLLVLAVAAMSLAAVSDEALAWRSSARATYNVLGWKFYKVKAQNGRLGTEKCKIELTFLWKSPAVDVIRFKALIEFKSGATMWTPEFVDSAIGKRKYSYTVDTTNQGCWGKKKQRPTKIAVLGCLPEREGKDCKPSRR